MIDWGSYEYCPFDLELKDVNRVRVNARLPFDSNPECTPTGSGSEPILLRDGGTGFITCKFRKPESGTAFRTPLHIELDYVYSSSKGRFFIRETVFLSSLYTQTSTEPKNRAKNGIMFRRQSGSGC